MRCESTIKIITWHELVAADIAAAREAKIAFSAGQYGRYDHLLPKQFVITPHHYPAYFMTKRQRKCMFCLYTIMPEAEIGMANTTTINFYEYFAFFKFRFVFFNLFKSLVGAHHLPLMYFMIIVHDYKFEFSYKTAVPCPPPIHADAI